MSDTSQTPSETQPAPLPWFETDQEGDTEPQPWRPAQENIPLFGIAFSPSQGDRLRCNNRILRTRPELVSVACFVFGGYFMAQQWSSHLVNCIIAGRWTFPKTLVLLSPLIGITAVLISIPFFHIIVTANQLFAMRGSPASPYWILATTQNLCYQTPRKSGSFKWKEVRGIVLNDDDIYMHGLPIDSCIYIPPNAEAAKRFYASLVALWKGGGDPNQVPEGICTEFAPPPGTAGLPDPVPNSPKSSIG